MNKLLVLFLVFISINIYSQDVLNNTGFFSSMFVGELELKNGDVKKGEIRMFKNKELVHFRGPNESDKIEVFYSYQINLITYNDEYRFAYLQLKNKNRICRVDYYGEKIILFYKEVNQTETENHSYAPIEYVVDRSIDREYYFYKKDGNTAFEVKKYNKQLLNYFSDCKKVQNLISRYKSEKTWLTSLVTVRSIVRLYDNCNVIFPIVESGQSIESDGITIVLEDYDEMIPDYGLIRKEKVILGSFIVEKDKETIGTHEFIVTIVNEEIGHITVLDYEGQKIFPKLYYQKNTKAFLFTINYDEEAEEFALKSSSREEIVISGLLIWSKIIYNK